MPCISRRWQVDGYLFDVAGRLYRVEFHGECAPDAFDELRRCVGWPEQRLLFELLRDGETVDEAEFRPWADGEMLMRRQ